MGLGRERAGRQATRFPVHIIPSIANVSTVICMFPLMVLELNSSFVYIVNRYINFIIEVIAEMSQ